MARIIDTTKKRSGKKKLVVPRCGADCSHENKKGKRCNGTCKRAEGHDPDKPCACATHILTG